jgi:hypothetical protein
VKKLFAPLILSSFALMLLSSCSNTSKLSFTKRHYRAGFFVDLVSKNKTIPVATKPVRANHPISPIAITKPEIHAAVNIPAATTNIVPRKTEKSYPVNITTNIANKKVKESYPLSVSTNTTKQLFDQTLVVIENLAEKTSQILSGYPEYSVIQLNELKISNSGLSIFWIAIVGVLVIWLAGMIEGLSGGINILLIVALVLEILWLLRIV